MIRGVAVGALVFAIVGYIGVLGFMYARQTQLEFPANRTPITLPQMGLAGFSTVSLKTRDGLELQAWYRPAAPGRPTILFLHGNASNLNGVEGQIGHLSYPGYGMLALEYRGYGGNPGTPSGSGLATDADSAMAFLNSRDVPADRVVVYGHSMGTGVATELAARVQVAALVLDCPFTSLAAVGQARYPYLPVGLLLNSKFPVEALLPQVHAPVLIVQGARDHTVPPAMGRADFAAANEPKGFWSAPEAGHMQVLEQGGAAVVQAFLQQHVAGG